jgi:hypothetical protein
MADGCQIELDVLAIYWLFDALVLLAYNVIGRAKRWDARSPE